MANTLTAFSTDDSQAHEFRIFDDSGAQVGTVIAATIGASGTYKYTAAVPGGTAAGAYTFALYRSSNGRLRAQGEFYWNGTDIVIAAEVAEANAAAIANLDFATEAEVNAARDAVQADIAAVQTDVTETQARVTLVRDILEGDESTNITGGTGTVQTFLKGTTTVIRDKTVSLGTSCDIDSDVTEAP